MNYKTRVNIYCLLTCANGLFLNQLISQGKIAKFNDIIVNKKSILEL